MKEKEEKKFQITIKLKVKGDKELILSMEDAKELHKILSEIFEKEKIYISYPWYYTYPVYDNIVPQPHKYPYITCDSNDSKTTSSYTISMNKASISE